jgi:hypothetical protein
LAKAERALAAAQRLLDGDPEVDFTPADAAAALGRAREFVAAVGSVISSAG